jgi:Predicted nucleotide-utilizing enzyme related to molybdopterin-biosynthesis enzyme MoeA
MRMDVAIITVGDELLAGETENTNGTWLAREITERGGRVVEMLTVGDEQDRIADRVKHRAERFDRVLVTGGLGGTPDDVTMEAVAKALDRELVVDASARETAKRSSKAFVESHPDLAEKYDLGLDLDRVAETVAGGDVIENPAGLAQGCVVENVYVLPGVPSELQRTFDQIAEDFVGDVEIETRYTDAPEGVLADHLATMETEFDVRAGSYPGERTDRNRVRITAEDPAELDRAFAWLGDRVSLENGGESI